MATLELTFNSGSELCHTLFVPNCVRHFGIKDILPKCLGSEVFLGLNFWRVCTPLQRDYTVRRPSVRAGQKYCTITVFWHNDVFPTCYSPEIQVFFRFWLWNWGVPSIIRCIILHSSWPFSCRFISCLEHDIMDIIVELIIIIYCVHICSAFCVLGF